ncbi:MAG: hypothetical protein LWX01_04225 [Deltaproteobacteria bacterium]|nr:hypothetical protein [Deltaproteobacteria bacterium]MDL1960895.1 hypothetical protein [Deltaproteobacteria bacterium]
MRSERIRASLHRSSRLRDAKEKDTWRDKQVSDNPAQSKEIEGCPRKAGPTVFHLSRV